MPEEKSLAIYCSILLLGNKLNYSVETKSCLAGLKYSIKKTKQKKMRRRGRGISGLAEDGGSENNLNWFAELNYWVIGYSQGGSCHHAGMRLL